MAARLDGKRQYYSRGRGEGGGKGNELSLGFVEFEVDCGILSGDVQVECIVGRVPWMQRLREGFTGKVFIKGERDLAGSWGEQGREGKGEKKGCG